MDRTEKTEIIFIPRISGINLMVCAGENNPLFLYKFLCVFLCVFGIVSPVDLFS